MANRGELVSGLLKTLLRDNYFSRRPPKTAGREQYGAEYVRALVDHPLAKRAAPEDLVRTATVLTALSILDAVHRFIPRNSIAELIVSGGGARNPLLMAQLESGLSGIRLRRSGEFGVAEDAKEAFAFALLAYQTIHKRPANLPAATGARRPAILGKVCYAGE
jgi:anhydro-N-acetylmuramic acid kinase